MIRGVVGALEVLGLPRTVPLPGVGVAASTDSMPPTVERAAPAPVAAIAFSMSRRAIRAIRILLVCRVDGKSGPNLTLSLWAGKAARWSQS